MYDQFEIKQRELPTGQIEFYVEAWGFDDGNDNVTTRWMVTRNNEIIKETNQSVIQINPDLGPSIIQVTVGGSWSKWVQYPGKD